MTVKIVSVFEKIFSIAKKIVSVVEKIFTIAKKIVGTSEKIFSTTEKIVSVVEKIFTIAKTIVKMTEKILSTAVTTVAAGRKMVYSVQTVVRPVNKDFAHRNLVLTNRASPIPSWLFFVSSSPLASLAIQEIPDPIGAIDYNSTLFAHQNRCQALFIFFRRREAR